MSVEINIEFERECYKCYGASAAWLPDKTPDKTCEVCHNTGQVPTELGRKLLEFLESQGFKRLTAITEGSELK